MRIVLDTNVLFSALLVRGTPPDRIYEAWRRNRFELASCVLQLREIAYVSRRPAMRGRIRRSEVGRMVNQIRRLAWMCDPLPAVSLSPDPNDDFLLAVARKAKADFLVTGDKSGSLVLGRFETTRIVTARTLIDLL